MPNRSKVLRTLEWVDRSAREGDPDLLESAKRALEEELAVQREFTPPEQSYKIAFESFVRKHGREPMEDIIEED